MSFCHLHTHSHYSILEGLGTPERYVKRAQELNQTALALTDHGNLYGAIEFYKSAKKKDIHPVIGVEFWMAIDKRTDCRPKIDSKAYNLILLAENQKGYENLIQLVTRSHLEGFYYRPRVDWELLEEYREGLICLSSDMRGIVAHHLLAGMPEEAKAHLKRFQTLYGQENVFVELEDHPKIENQVTVNQMLVDLAKDCKAPLIATNDVHYPTPDDSEAQDVLLCIKDNRNIDDAHRWRYLDDYSMKSTEEMIKAFADHPEAVTNTMEIAQRCQVQFQFGENLIPHFPTPKKQSSHEYLRELVAEGLKERYGVSCSVADIVGNRAAQMSPKEKEIMERMNYELNTVHEMGFDEYFLIVWDFIKYAKDKDILVGPGRGSAAGAIIAYCLKITDLDPLKYDLLFERFLNPARVSMPDIDIDFQDDRRDEILEYVTEKYGRDRVAQVITFGTLAAKASLKDTGRVFGVPFQEMNQLTKLVPSRPGTMLEEALESEPELKEEYDRNELFRKIYDTGLKLEGTVRQVGVHACAVIISRDELTKHTPLQQAPGGNEAIITQYSMKPLEDLGLLKMDFLGLRNLSILKSALKIIKRRHGKDLDLLGLPMDDEKTYALLSEGHTTGVFQLESSGMKRYLKDLKPSSFEDIIAMGALYRPGPMQFIPDYIEGKHGTREVKYVHDDLKLILEKTYGIAVYQEQILQIAQKFAGFTLGEADLLRRAIGKKIAKELTDQRQKFIKGGVTQGYSEKLATDIFDKVIEPFSNYGFNKSHAACYAMISYQTAYLKAHYPAEFMAALLTADQDNTDRVIIDIRECEVMGITILPPDINESYKGFTVTANNTIRYGLSAIKNLGADTIDHISKARKERGPFRDLADLLHRIPQKCVNKKSFEALTMSGALDAFGERNALMNSMDMITGYAKQYGKGQMDKQTDLFGMLSERGEEHPIELTTTQVASWFQKLKWEKEALGMYVSDHPLKGLRQYMQRKVKLIGNLSASLSDQEISIGGLVNNVRKITTKRGETMVVFELEDLTGKISVVLFPRVYYQIKDADFFGDDAYFIIAQGKVDRRAGELQFIARSIGKSSIQSMRENAMEQGVYDPQESQFASLVVGEEDDFAQNTPVSPPLDGILFQLKESVELEDLHTIKEILERYPGDKPVSLNLIVEGQRKNIPTGILVDDILSLRKDMEPYVED
ncbi:MAG: DNA polymerase III subunit alpha [bacterium]|nr:DNA polymerase III subunit alpha [bacterium]